MSIVHLPVLLLVWITAINEESLFPYTCSLHRSWRIAMNYPAASYITALRLFPAFEAVGSQADRPLHQTKLSVNPFSPEAKVPLPKEIEDLGYGTSVWKRNRRERDRVRCVNEGYETLRNCLPLAEHEKRISKVDTLRFAIFYIKHLDRMIKQEDHEIHCSCFDNFQTEATQNPLCTKQQRNTRKRTIDH